MSKAIVFLHYRAGSSFFQHLSGNTPFFLCKDIGIEPEISTEYYNLTTKHPKVLAKYTDCGSITKLANQFSHLTHACILTHIGNWWGNEPVPAPLSSPSPMKWGVEELSPFTYQGWKFINLIRDGRNMIESTRNKMILHWCVKQLQ